MHLLVQYWRIMDLEIAVLGVFLVYLVFPLLVVDTLDYAKRRCAISVKAIGNYLIRQYIKFNCSCCLS